MRDKAKDAFNRRIGLAAKRGGKRGKAKLGAHSAAKEVAHYEQMAAVFAVSIRGNSSAPAFKTNNGDDYDDD